jgi:IS30 family transposase
MKPARASLERRRFKVAGDYPVTPLEKVLIFYNGKEFTEHSRIDTALQSTMYFADPFASWQRGSNENFNG